MRSQSTNSLGPRQREAIGILLLAVALFFSFSLGLFFISKEQLMGQVGTFLSVQAYRGFGVGALLFSGLLFLVAFRLLTKRSPLMKPWDVAGFFGLLIAVCILFALWMGPGESRAHNESNLYGMGGGLGIFATTVLHYFLGIIGTYIFSIALFMLSVLMFSSRSWGSVLSGAFEKISSMLRRRFKRKNLETREVIPVQPAKPIEPVQKNSLEEIEVIPPIDKAKAPLIAFRTPPLARVTPPSSESETVASEITVIEPAPHTRPLTQHYLKTAVGEYQFPSLELLDYTEQEQAELDKQAMFELAQKLEKTLADYQVKGRVTQIRPGPVVTMYEFAPSPGTKLSKITALASDLAMALEALRVRIIAPIPGKAAVGIEVPNRERETVYLKEILADASFTEAKSRLTIALGKDIFGSPSSVDLAKMPHLLVAGTTGSGKSVAVNAMISSLLFHSTPDEVKLIMIDPKMLELSIYEGIPHLLLPVVTDPKKANLALKWAVDEMERRYAMIAKTGVRDIGGYNRYVETLQNPAVKTPVLEVDQSEDDDSTEESAESGQRRLITNQTPLSAEEEPAQKLPYIVVLIDEFADLMMVASKEVEISVARIAQKARAAGIHLIVATQRPSVDVITGLIKANFPSRIAFQVASRIDSRTILDAQGAEALLGMGDMLFMDRGQPVQRIHGALVTDKEIHRLVEHLKKQGRPVYNMDILKPRLEESDEEDVEDLSDEMYDQAVRIVTESRQASISMIQRRLRIGYNRAARMMERMEKEGVVSAADGAKGRDVLVGQL